MIGSLSRPMRFLVIGSLALNLFGIGAIAADAIMDRDGHGGLFGHAPPASWACEPRELRGLPRAIRPSSMTAEGEQAIPPAFDVFRRVRAPRHQGGPFDRRQAGDRLAALREREARRLRRPDCWSISSPATQRAQGGGAPDRRHKPRRRMGRAERELRKNVYVNIAARAGGEPRLGKRFRVKHRASGPRSREASWNALAPKTGTLCFQWDFAVACQGPSRALERPVQNRRLQCASRRARRGRDALIPGDRAVAGALARRCRGGEEQSSPPRPRVGGGQRRGAGSNPSHGLIRRFSATPLDPIFYLFSALEFCAVVVMPRGSLNSDGLRASSGDFAGVLILTTSPGRPLSRPGWAFFIGAWH
jgi:hypothetical protein